MKIWNVKDCPPDQASKLARSLSVSPFIAHLLINRNICDPSVAQRFLHDTLKDLPHPSRLKDMDKAVDRLMTAIDREERIVIYGDYDVDGTTATSMLMLFFREIGFPVHFYVPHRMREGYSLNVGAIEKLKGEGTNVIITVDNGIVAFKEAQRAKELGIDLIITDHHETADQLPEALAVINPRRSDCPYEAKEICGSGVAFNLMMALRTRLRESGYFENRPEPNLRKYLDLLSIATVADVVPLVGANRIFVRTGLKQLEDTAWPGLKALKEVCSIDGKVNAGHLGFRIGPRLNACGRLYDASTGVKLLISTDLEEARRMSRELDGANLERQGIEKQIFQEAVQLCANDPAFENRLGHVLFSESWHPGVIGIVASRMVERFHRPFILLGKDTERIKGSGRSYGGMDLIAALRECESMLVKCGGHKAAAGMTLMPDRLEEFRIQFDQKVKDRLTVEQCVPRINIDTEIAMGEIHDRVMDELELLEPYGQGNPEPLFCMRKVAPRLEKIVGNNHLKFQLWNSEKSLEAIAFGMGDHLGHLKGSSIDVAFCFSMNEFRGSKTLQLQIKDLIPSQL